MTINERNITGGMSRRQLLAAGGAALTGIAAGIGPATAQSGGSIDALMVNSIIGGKLREIVEGKSGVKVADGPFVSSTDTIAKLLSPGSATRYDLLMSVSEFSRAPVMGSAPGQEKIIPFDPALVPNAKDLTPIGRDDVLERDGKVWLQPIYWGYDMVLYNQEHVPDEDPLTQSWGLLFADKYAGRIAWFDAPHQMMMGAALHLGLKEPEKADRNELAEITKFLISKKKNVRTMWTSPAQAISLMASGEVVVTYGFIPVRVALQKQGLRVTNNWPSEGLLIWSHSGYIAKTSPKAAAAHAVVNAFLSPEYGAALTRETGYLSVVKGAEALLTPEERKASGYDIRERGLKTYGLKYPPELARWVEAWGKVKSA
jgi:spermidine/putrescine transport system substrate-binding protein